MATLQELRRIAAAEGIPWADVEAVVDGTLHISTDEYTEDELLDELGAIIKESAGAAPPLTGGGKGDGGGLRRKWLLALLAATVATERAEAKAQCYIPIRADLAEPIDVQRAIVSVDTSKWSADKVASYIENRMRWFRKGRPDYADGLRSYKTIVELLGGTLSGNEKKDAMLAADLYDQLPGKLCEQYTDEPSRTESRTRSPSPEPAPPSPSPFVSPSASHTPSPSPSKTQSPTPTNVHTRTHSSKPWVPSNRPSPSRRSKPFTGNGGQESAWDTMGRLGKTAYDNAYATGALLGLIFGSALAARSKLSKWGNEKVAEEAIAKNTIVREAAATMTAVPSEDALKVAELTGRLKETKLQARRATAAARRSPAGEPAPRRRTPSPAARKRAASPSARKRAASPSRYAVSSPSIGGRGFDDATCPRSPSPKEQIRRLGAALHGVGSFDVDTLLHADIRGGAWLARDHGLPPKRAKAARDAFNRLVDTLTNSTIIASLSLFLLGGIVLAFGYPLETEYFIDKWTTYFVYELGGYEFKKDVIDVAIAAQTSILSGQIRDEATKAKLGSLLGGVKWAAETVAALRGNVAGAPSVLDKVNAVQGAHGAAYTRLAGWLVPDAIKSCIPKLDLIRSWLDYGKEVIGYTASAGYVYALSVWLPKITTVMVQLALAPAVGYATAVRWMWVGIVSQTVGAYFTEEIAADIRVLLASGTIAAPTKAELAELKASVERQGIAVVQEAIKKPEMKGVVEALIGAPAPKDGTAPASPRRSEEAKREPEKKERAKEEKERKEEEEVKEEKEAEKHTKDRTDRKDRKHTKEKKERKSVKKPARKTADRRDSRATPAEPVRVDRVTRPKRKSTEMDDDCEAFRRDPTVNPRTGRAIDPDGPTARALRKRCA